MSDLHLKPQCEKNSKGIFFVVMDNQEEIPVGHAFRKCTPDVLVRLQVSEGCYTQGNRNCSCKQPKTDHIM